MESIIVELIEKNKKNSRLSIADKDLFENSLFDELSKGKYDEEMEKTLCEGPADSTMKALALYLTSIETGDAYDFMKKFVNSNRIQENKGGASGTRMVFLVASLIENTKEQNKLLEFAFTTMVWFAYRKENGNLNKKVVDQIRNSIFPLFDNRESILDLQFIDKDKPWYRARDLFVEAMMNMEKTSFGRIQKVYEWLKSSGRNMGKYTEKYITQKVLEQTKQSKNDSASNDLIDKENNIKSNTYENEEKKISNQIQQPKQVQKSSDNTEIIDSDVKEQSHKEKTGVTQKENHSDKLMLEIVGVILAEYDSQKKLSTEVGSLTKKITEMQLQINKLLGKEEEQRTYIQELVTEKRNLIAENTSDENKIQELTEAVKKLEREIDDRKQFTDTVTRNREKQSEEQLNKLASKLRVDYRDYCDAKDIDMTIDLGENMREQLGAVFSILEKSGIKLS